MSSEDVFDLYWPKDWHFCTPPGKPTACGRFGPHEDRVWSHEFAEHGWKDGMDATELLWEHITPMITHDRDSKGRRFAGGQVAYPRDCVQIIRCRPFAFAHKVVNKWFDHRTILIGDAAHVFPPFGGEGIASGIRDAHQLAWRIALAENLSLNEPAIELQLDMWSAERRRGVKNAANFTKLNGTLCNEPESWRFYIFRNVESILKMTPLFSLLPNPLTMTEARGYQGVEDGFFLPEYSGGGKLAQVFMESSDGGGTFLSDNSLKHGDSLLTLIVLDRNYLREATYTLVSAGLPSGILEPAAAMVVSSGTHDAHLPVGSVEYRLATRPRGKVIKGYDHSTYLSRLGKGSYAYAIVRPDFYIFALLRDGAELHQALLGLKGMLTASSDFIASTAKL